MWLINMYIFKKNKYKLNWFHHLEKVQMVKTNSICICLEKLQTHQLIRSPLFSGKFSCTTAFFCLFWKKAKKRPKILIFAAICFLFLRFFAHFFAEQKKKGAKNAKKRSKRKIRKLHEQNLCHQVFCIYQILNFRLGHHQYRQIHHGR